MKFIHKIFIYSQKTNLHKYKQSNIRNKIAVYLKASLHRRRNLIEMQEIRFLHLYSQNASS